MSIKLHHGVGQLVAHQLQESLLGGPKTIGVPGDLPIGQLIFEMRGTKAIAAMLNEAQCSCQWNPLYLCDDMT